MPGLSPESATRSARVATAIRTEMKRHGLSGADLAKRIETVRGSALPNGMWLSRRLTGKVQLVEPVQVLYGPTPDLALIIRALTGGKDTTATTRRVLRSVNARVFPGADARPAKDDPAEDDPEPSGSV